MAGVREVICVDSDESLSELDPFDDEPLTKVAGFGEQKAVPSSLPADAPSDVKPAPECEQKASPSGDTSSAPPDGPGVDSKPGPGVVDPPAPPAPTAKMSPEQAYVLRRVMEGKSVFFTGRAGSGEGESGRGGGGRGGADG
jgi:hypothetical protein